MAKDTIQLDSKSTSQVKTLVSFTEAISRIFKIGIYYPVGHAVLDQAASKCINLLREVFPSQISVTITVEGEILLVEKTRLPENDVPVKDLRQFLSALGVKSIEINKNVTQKQFLHFVKSLLHWRTQLERAQSFVGFNLDDLPDSIKIKQKKYLVDEALLSTGESVEEYQQNMEKLYETLSQQGLTKPQVQQCKELLESLSRPIEGKNLEITGFPNATWKDVQQLLFKIVTGSYSQEQQRFEPVVRSDINAITSIFESLERTHTDKKSREAIELLVSHLSGSKKTEPQKTKKKGRADKKTNRPTDAREMVSVEKLKDFIFQNNIPLKVLEKIISVDRSEELSILLQLINPEQNRQLSEDIEDNLRNILKTALTTREKDVLLAGTKHFADIGETDYFQHFLSVILESRRSLEPMNSQVLIVEIWSKMPYAMHLLLWPFVVNELLIVGMGENKESFSETTEIASHLHKEGMKSLLYRLEEMDAFQKKRVAPVIFRSSYIYSYRLFVTLFDTSLGDVIAKKVLSALREGPQDILMEAVGPLLDLTLPQHLEFLRSYLKQAHLEEPPLALRMAAGQIVLMFLQQISDEQRELPWVETTIASIPSFYVKGLRSMLERVIKEKKLGVVPLWPKNCRKVAEDTLKSLKRRSLKDLL